MAENGNGNGSITAPKLVWWVMGFLATVLFAAATGWMNHVEAQLSKASSEVSSTRERLMNLETRLGHIEVNTKETGQDVREVRRMLEERFDARQPPPRMPRPYQQQ